MGLYPYQKRAIAFLTQQPRALLSIDMRMGKTAIVLHHINNVKPESVIIVAPKFVVNYSWIQEAVKWNLQSVADKMIIVAGTPKQRHVALNNTAKPYKVISRDNLADVKDYQTDILVLDEITSFKSVYASRSHLVRSIRAKQYIGLTGTFLANGAIDIFGQFAALHVTRANVRTVQSKRGKPYVFCPEFEAWRAEHFYDAMAGSGQSFHKWRMIESLESIIKPFRKHIFTLDAADYKLLAPRTFDIHTIEMSKSERNEYISLSSMLTVELSGETLTVSEGAKFAKLQTLCNGFIYDTDGTAYRGKSSSKLEAVADFCASAAGEGEAVLLFYAFREEAIWLAELLDERGLKYCSTADKKFIDKWNNHDIDVLLMHPGSSFGLNLQYGGHICVWSSITYNFEHWDQANARLIGSGQTKPVSINVFAAANTIEQLQYKAVMSKVVDNQEFKDITK